MMLGPLQPSFGSPHWLWAIAPIMTLLVVDARRRWPHTSPARHAGGTAMRFAVLVSLLLALSDPRCHQRAAVSHVIMVVDRSDSISDDILEQAMHHADELRHTLPPRTRVGLVLFDGAAEPAVVPGSAWTSPRPLRGTSTDTTDIDAGLQLALDMIPLGQTGAIVLFSDGRATSFDQSRVHVIDQARSRAIAVHTIALAPHRHTAAITAITMADASIRPGQTIEGTVQLDGASDDTRGEVTISTGDTIIYRATVEAPARTTKTIAFTHALTPDMVTHTIAIEARFVPEGSPQNKTASTRSVTVPVSARPHVRIFYGETHDADALATVLRSEAMDVQLVDAHALDRQDEDLTTTDLVVLVNAPVTRTAADRRLNTRFLEHLRRFVDRGGGLIVSGGPQAFDMGGYDATPLAKALPVKMDSSDLESNPSATILIILDRSGSMSAMVTEQKTKMHLADEGAAASVRLLRPFDRAGVMSVTESVRWDIPIQATEDISAFEQQIASIQADGGGGIFVYTALEAAQRAMARVDSPLRHVILFADAADSAEQIRGVPFGGGPGPTALELAAAMRTEGITTSVIGIGEEDDVDTPFLGSLARAGGGKFYLTDDPEKLRALFVTETERLVDTSVRKTAFRPRLRRDHTIVAGVDYARGPELDGYQKLHARPTATVILAGPDNDPLLTTWRYGLGHVVTWASDAGPRWSKRWLDWNGYHRQWTQIARYLLRPRAVADTAVSISHRGHSARINVVRRDHTGLTFDGRVRAQLIRDDQTSDMPMIAVEPGWWQATVTGLEPAQLYTLDIRDASGKTLAEHTFVPPSSEEGQIRTPDVPALASIAQQTGGLQNPKQLQPPTSVVTTETLRLWPFFLLLALFLFPLDAVLRRPARVL